MVGASRVSHTHGHYPRLVPWNIILIQIGQTFCTASCISNEDIFVNSLSYQISQSHKMIYFHLKLVGTLFVHLPLLFMMPRYDMNRSSLTRDFTRQNRDLLWLAKILILAYQKTIQFNGIQLYMSHILDIVTNMCNNVGFKPVHVDIN